MVDDSKYVIVPNKLKADYSLKGAETEASNDNGRYLAQLIMDGYRIISRASNRDAAHYVLIKFKPDTRLPKRGEIKPPIEPAIIQDPAVEDPL